MKHQAEVLMWWLPAGRLMTPDSQSERSICVLSGRWKPIYIYIGFIVLILMKQWRRNVMIRCETWGCRCKRRSVDLLLKHCTGTDGRGYFSWSCLTFTQNKWKQTEQKHFRGRRSELFHVVSCSQQKWEFYPEWNCPLKCSQQHFEQFVEVLYSNRRFKTQNESSVFVPMSYLFPPQGISPVFKTDSYVSCSVSRFWPEQLLWILLLRAGSQEADE